MLFIFGSIIFALILPSTNKNIIFLKTKNFQSKFKEISNAIINNVNLLKINLHILVPKYLKKKISCFIKVLTKDNIKKIAKKSKVTNSQKEKKNLPLRLLIVFI